MYSIIIPAKNEEKIIGKLLECIKNQTLKPDQVIVADKSTDSTKIILEKFGAIIVEGNDEGYIGKARNNGAKASTKELLVFLDADVEFENEYMEKVINDFNKKNLDIATTFLKPNSKSKWPIIPFKAYNGLKVLQEKTKKVISDTGTCLIVKREVFNKVGGFSEHLKNAEDIDLIKRVMKQKYKFGVMRHLLLTSVRRFDRGGIKGLALLALGAVGMTLIVRSKRLSKTKLHDTFVRWYGKTGG